MATAQTLETPPTPPPPPGLPRRRKFWLGYLLSILGMVAAGLCVVSFALSIFSMTSGAPEERALMPGEAEFQLQAGKYVINYDEVSHVEGRSFQSPPLIDKSAVACRLVHVETGQDLPLVPSETNMTYSITYGSKRYSGVTLLKVTVDQPGRYRLHGGPLPGADAGKPYVLAVSKAGFVKGIVLGVLTMLVGFALGLAGLAGLIVTIVLHVGYRKKVRANASAA